MIAQNGLNRRGTKFIRRVDYEAVRSCLRGKWSIIEEIIKQELSCLDVNVYIFKN